MDPSVLLTLLALASATHAQVGAGPNGASNIDGGDGWSWNGGGNNNDNDNDNDNFGYGYDYGFSSGGAGFDVGTATRYRTTHGILASVAFVALFPLGSILMRVVPGRFAWVVHATTQVVAYVLYVAAAGLGLWLVSMVRIPPNGTSLLTTPSTNAHPIIGILLLAVLLLQPALGVVHHRRFRRVARRTWVSHAHLWTGRLAVTLGIVNGGLGLGLAGASRSAVVAYSVVAAVMWLLWVAAAVFGEVRRRRRGSRAGEKANELAEEEEDRGRRVGRGPAAGSPSPPYMPGPLYGGPPVYRQGQGQDQGYDAPGGGGYAVGRRPVKDANRSDTVSSLSSGTRRGQV